MIFYINPWTSGITRGKQIADAIGAQCNPDRIDSFDDVFIFVKAYPDGDLVSRARNVYIDIVDDMGLVAWINDNPTVTVLIVSEDAKNHLSKYVSRDRIIVIPEHHCNFEHAVRDVNRPVRTVGFCGYCTNFHLDFVQVRKSLLDIGLDFKLLVDFISREEVCDFYKSIDISIAYRVYDNISRASYHLKNPLKLANAGSFKVPSVSYPEVSYVSEFGDCFLHVKSHDELILACKRLKDDSNLYKNLSCRAYERSKNYDMDKIVPLYRELERR